MPILITCIGLVVLILLMSYFKWNPFLAFLLVATGVGLGLNIPPSLVVTSIQKGMGETLKFIVGIIVLGSMLGKLVATSGATQKIVNTLMDILGTSRLRWAFMITGFIIGLPLFYGVAFILLAPIVITVAHKTKSSATYLVMPMLASLGVMQCFLPPHPAPTAIMYQLGADMGHTLFYGIIIAIPAILIAGMLFGSLTKNVTTLPNKAFIFEDDNTHKSPSTFISFFSILSPIILIVSAVILLLFIPKHTTAYEIIFFIGEPLNSMFISVLIAIYFLGIKQGKNMKDIGNTLIDSIKDVASLLLIFAGSGALKEILTVGNVSQYIADITQVLNVNPLFLGWLMCAMLHVSIGASTVAALTTAGFMLPIMAVHHTNPHLMVLAIGSGSMMLSHVNASGFWLFREYFQLSFKDMLRFWSAMDTIISIIGILGVLALDWFLK